MEFTEHISERKTVPRNYCLLWEKGTWYLFEVEKKVIGGMGFSKNHYKVYSVDADNKQKLYYGLKKLQQDLDKNKVIPSRENKRQVFPSLESILKK